MNWREVLLSIVLCLVATVLMTTSKVSLLFLWTLKDDAPQPQWYAAMTLVVLVPEVTSLLRTVWSCSLLVSGATRHWPSASVIALGLGTAVLETAVVTFFTLEVASSVPPYVVLPVMQSLLLLPLLLDQWHKVKKRRHTLEVNAEVRTTPETSWCGVRVSCVLAVLGLCLLLGVGVMTVLLGVAPLPHSLALPACLLILSLAWCRPLRQRVYCATSPLPTRHNVRLLLGVVRVGLFLAFSLLIPAVAWEGGTARAQALDSLPAALWTGLRLMPDTPAVLWALVTHCLSSMASYLWGRLGVYYDLPGVSLALPSVMSTVLASVLSLLHCSPLVTLMTRGLCDINGLHLAVFSVAACVWLLPLMVLGKAYFRHAQLLFRPEEDSFLSLNYSSVCLDQNLFLDYSPRSFMGRHQPCPTAEAARPKTRVFMCTTMYREADHEMEQLLRSLAAVSKSEKLKDAQVYMESHIFLDNGARGFTLQEFALQLMSLVETCLSVARQDSVVHKTPYGIQIRSVLAGGMPLFLHLKDSSLVKAKKRWSQVMYMKYVIDHRIKTFDRSKPDADTSSVCFTVNERDLAAAKEGGSEVLLKVHSLLRGLGAQDSTSDTLKVPGQDSWGDFSEQSSDQGIGDDDCLSTVSDLSSARSQSLKAEDGSAGQDATITRSSSYGSLTSADTVQGVHNAAYTHDSDVEDPDYVSGQPATWCVQDPPIVTVTSPGACCVQDSPWQTSGVPGIFAISGEPDATSLQMEDSRAAEDAGDSHTYILATDADVLFSDTAVMDLVTTCNHDLSLGAACGRTLPTGHHTHPIVWHQMFEYAKDFWMIKSAQNVVGSVMCCPGCFSLYRVEAIQDVLEQYCQPSTGSMDVFTKDTGEDRWMCTLMMLRGWRMRYVSRADNITYCPDNVSEFFKQRRRWILSDVANTFIVLRNMARLVSNNGSFTFLYVLYLLLLFLVFFISPGTTVVVLTVGADQLIGVSFYVVTPVVMAVCVLYGLACCLLSQRLQMLLTKILMVVLGVCTAGVIVAGLVRVTQDLVEKLSQSSGAGGSPGLEHYLLLGMVGVVLYAALLHPTEAYLLLHGLASLLCIPTMYILLPVYAFANIVDQSWGTRDNQKAKVPKLSCFPKLRLRKKKKNKASTSDGNEEEQSEVQAEQTQALSEDEAGFWKGLVDSVLGMHVQKGLTTGQVATSLRTLRLQAVLGLLLTNLLWVAGLSAFYVWSLRESSSSSPSSLPTSSPSSFSSSYPFSSTSSSSSPSSSYPHFSSLSSSSFPFSSPSSSPSPFSISSPSSSSPATVFFVVVSCMYAFPLLVQLLGMTFHSVQDAVRQLGNTVFGPRPPRYVHGAQHVQQVTRPHSAMIACD